MTPTSSSNWMQLISYFGCEMLLLLSQARKSLFPSIQTFTNFLLTEFESFLTICCRSCINSIWWRVRAKKRIWKNKIISSKAKSHGAGIVFSLSHLVIVMLPCAQLSWCHTMEGWTLKATLLWWNSWCTVYVKNADYSWDVFYWQGFQSNISGGLKRRNYFFWWLNFTSLWNMNKPSLSFLNPGYSFSTWLFLNREQ